MSEDPTQRLHSLELRLHSIESRLGFWRGLVIAAIAFLGISTGAGLWTLYDRTLDEADRAVFDQARQTIQAFRQQAEGDALAVRAALASAYHDPGWVEKTGRCIYPVMLSGHYTLNYGAAAAICAAQGARLCTLAEVRDAHSKGAQWWPMVGSPTPSARAAGSGQSPAPLPIPIRRVVRAVAGPGSTSCRPGTS